MKIRGACGAVSALTLETRGNSHGVGESVDRWVTEERRRSVCVPGGPLACGAKRRARGVSRGWGWKQNPHPVGGLSHCYPKGDFPGDSVPLACADTCDFHKSGEVGCITHSIFGAASRLSSYHLSRKIADRKIIDKSSEGFCLMSSPGCLGRRAGATGKRGDREFFCGC